MNTKIINIIVGIAVGLFVLSLINSNSQREGAVDQTSYSQFLAEVKRGEVSEVFIDGQTIRGQRDNGESFSTFSPNDAGLVGDLLDNGVEIRAIPP
jgi:cell division protease FtsH